MTSTSPIRPGEPLADDHALLALAEYLHRGADPRDRVLWFAMLDERRRPLPVLVPVDDLPATPSETLLAALDRIWAEVVAEHAVRSLMFLLERPGAETVDEADRAWLAALRGAAARHGLEICGFFLATGAGVRPFAPDDWS